MKRANIVICICVVLFCACASEKAEEQVIPDECTLNPVSFSKDILPIFEQNCDIPDCHGTPARFSGFMLTNYQEISDAASLPSLLSALKHESGTPMPRIDPENTDATKLPDSTIAKIECWISSGLPNN